ncbi:hypothetical protein [Geobacter argillaceus]|uniref:Uncharacterized protein n=1 Tax=Geobacter argillaceus TaxID=345631 RepID=A0A562WSZ8_9BACT|nr:hypothetical protein [Geobacter argillaceus]TWJ33563.1 hypothetical protein JN12_00237 [Geobacter argillaceus]
MRRSACLIFAVAVSLVIVASPLMSAETAIEPQAREECLLLARNCVDDIYTVQQRIERLRKEIEKGTEVYTPAELLKLKDALADAYRKLIDTVEGE